MPTKRRRAAFIGLPSPLGRREFGGNARIDGWAAEYVGYKMHTSSPSLREDGHSETLCVFGLLVFCCDSQKERGRETRARGLSRWRATATPPLARRSNHRARRARRG